MNEMLKQVNFPLVIRIKMKDKEKRFAKLSLQIGRSPSYLDKQLKQTDQPASLLILLSNHLQTNLFEPFMNLLPDDIRITQKEKTLQAEIAALQKQIEDLTKERDIYKGIVMK